MLGPRRTSSRSLFRSAIVLRRKNLRANNSIREKIFDEIKFCVIENITPDFCIGWQSRILFGCVAMLIERTRDGELAEAKLVPIFAAELKIVGSLSHVRVFYQDHAFQGSR
jgi:hypothetical protein